MSRRIVPYLLALLHLPVTCHQSGHIPPPAESRGGWPLSFTSIRHSPPAESLGNQVGRLTFIFLSSWGLEAHTTLRNGCRCHRHCDFLVCGRVPWHLRNPDQSTCVCRLYMAWTQAFSCPPSCTCLILTGAWFGALSRVCLHASLPRLFCFSAPPGYVLLYVQFCQPITEMWTVFPPKGCESTTKAP